MEESKSIDDLGDDQPEISLHAISGLQSSQIMQLKSIAEEVPLLILVDSGSTHISLVKQQQHI